MTSPVWRSRRRWSTALGDLRWVVEEAAIDLLQSFRTVAGPNRYGADGPDPGHRWTLAFGHGAILFVMIAL
jgi:hypothetical protein